jgi:hypothetical protein
MREKERVSLGKWEVYLYSTSRMCVVVLDFVCSGAQVECV